MNDRIKLDGDWHKLKHRVSEDTIAGCLSGEFDVVSFDLKDGSVLHAGRDSLIRSVIITAEHPTRPRSAHC